MLTVSIISGAIVGITIFEFFKRKLKRDIEDNCYKSRLEKVLLERRISELEDTIRKLERTESDLIEDIQSLSRTVEIISS